MVYIDFISIQKLDFKNKWIYIGQYRSIEELVQINFNYISELFKYSVKYDRIFNEDFIDFYDKNSLKYRIIPGHFSRLIVLDNCDDEYYQEDLSEDDLKDIYNEIIMIYEVNLKLNNFVKFLILLNK